MGCFITDMGRWSFATNVDDIKEWDAPESNKTIAGWELWRTYPILHLELAGLLR
jgi:hypothetical protein